MRRGVSKVGQGWDSIVSGAILSSLSPWLLAIEGVTGPEPGLRTLLLQGSSAWL